MINRLTILVACLAINVLPARAADFPISRPAIVKVNTMALVAQFTGRSDLSTFKSEPNEDPKNTASVARKKQLVEVFQNIRNAAAQVGISHGCAVVLADPGLPLPDNVDLLGVDDLRMRVNEHLTTFADESTNITAEVADLLTRNGGKVNAPDRAQPTSADGLPIAIVTIARTFNDLAETADLKSKMVAVQKQLQAEDRRRRDELAKLKNNKQALLQKQADYDAWVKAQIQQVQQDQKRKMVSLFDKIQEAINTVAHQRGTSIVIIRQEPDPVFDVTTVPESNVLLLLRAINVVWAADALDATADVTRRANDQYKFGNSAEVRQVAEWKPSCGVVTVDPARVFATIEETNDLKGWLAGDAESFQKEDLRRQDELKGLQAAKDALDPATPQFTEKDKEIKTKMADYKTWQQAHSGDTQHRQKVALRKLYEKIVSATGTVARAKGATLVCTDRRPQLPNNLSSLTVDQVRALLNIQPIGFADESVNITDAVIEQLDSDYKAGR